MAVPAALMSMTSGMLLRAAMITSVSSQSLKLLGCMLLPAIALITRARLLILLEAGKLMLAFIWLGAFIVYFFIRVPYILYISLQKYKIKSIYASKLVKKFVNSFKKVLEPLVLNVRGC